MTPEERANKIVGILPAIYPELIQDATQLIAAAIDEAVLGERERYVILQAERDRLAQWLEIEHMENVQGITIHLKDNPACLVCRALSPEAKEGRE